MTRTARHRAPVAPLVDVGAVARLVVTTGALAAVPVVATAGAAAAQVPSTSAAGTPAVKAASTLSVAASSIPANGGSGAAVTVRAGDTVSAIARAAGASTQAVLDLNGLGWSSVIYPGQVLRLPAGSAPAAPAIPAQAAAPAAETDTAHTAVEVAKQSVGLPYRFGGTSPTSGFDCSGLVQYAYSKVGVALPRTSAAMRSAGYAVSEPRVGDLVLFKNYGHVAMYAGNGKIIDSPRTGESVSVRSLWTDDVEYRRVV